MSWSYWLRLPFELSYDFIRVAWYRLFESLLHEITVYSWNLGSFLTTEIMATLEQSQAEDRPLPQLPTELIEEVFANVTDIKTLAAICSVSKLGQRVATPLLYHTLGIADEEFYTGDKVFCGTETLQKARSLQLQCRTLLENRELAKHVVEIRQYMNDHVYRHQHGMKIIKPKQVRQVLSKDIKLAPAVVQPIMDGLSGDNSSSHTDEVYFILLLALCPQVKTLRLEGGLGVMRILPWLDETLRSAFYNINLDHLPAGTPKAPTPASGIYTVTEVHLTSLGDGRSIGAEDMLPLLHLPGLQRITSDCLHPSISKGSQNGPIYLNSSVKTVEIQQCFAKDEDLEALFIACPNAESLRIEWGMREDNYRRFDWQNIGECITECMTKLKHLSFDHYPDLDPWQPDAQEMMEMMSDDYLKKAHLPGLGSLQALASLETLSLSRIALFGTHGDDDFDPDGHIDWSDDEEDPGDKHTLDTLLPESVKELTVLCEGLCFGRDDRALLQDPRAARLHNLTIKTCMKDRWISTRDGEGRTDPTSASMRAEKEIKRPTQNMSLPPPDHTGAIPLGDDGDDDDNYDSEGDWEDDEEMPVPPIEIRRAMFESLMAGAADHLPPALMEQLRERAMEQIRDEGRW